MTISGPSQEDVLAVAEDSQVEPAVAVDVERIRAVHGCQVRRCVMHSRETERPTDFPVVPKERGRVRATGDVDVGLAVAVAVEDRAAGSSEIGPTRAPCRG